MRKLDFSIGRASDYFEIIYDGLLQTPRGFAAPSETRIIGAVQDKLEAIANAIDVGEGGRSLATYRLNEVEALSNGMIYFEDAEYNLILAALKEVKWLTAAARKATAAMDWFEEAEKVDKVKEVKKEEPVGEAPDKSGD